MSITIELERLNFQNISDDDKNMRSEFKTPFYFRVNAKKNRFMNIDRKFVYKTKKRDLRIFKPMIGRKFCIYNGKSFTIINIGPDMLGCKLGEFSLTRIPVHHQRRKREKALAKKRKEELKKQPKVKIIDRKKIEAARSKRKSRR